MADAMDRANLRLGEGRDPRMDMLNDAIDRPTPRGLADIAHGKTRATQTTGEQRSLDRVATKAVQQYDRFGR